MHFFMLVCIVAVIVLVIGVVMALAIVGCFICVARSICLNGFPAISILASGLLLLESEITSVKKDHIEINMLCLKIAIQISKSN